MFMEKIPPISLIKIQYEIDRITIYIDPGRNLHQEFTCFSGKPNRRDSIVAVNRSTQNI
jgi:hypothetical protein